MAKTIRVAQIVGRMVGGGVEATVMNHYRHIDHSRVQFDFIVQEDSTKIPQDEITSLGGHVYKIPSYTHPLAYVRACEKIFADTHPDIVHSNMNAMSILPLLAAKKAGVKIRIAHSHSTANPHEPIKTVAKNILRPFSKVYPTVLAACSEHAAEWLFGHEAATNGTVHIIHNAIELDRFSFDVEKRNSIRHNLGINENILLIGQVGRLCTQKNQWFSLKIFSRLLLRNDNAILVFLGSGDDSVKLQSRAKELGIADKVKFAGIQDDTSLWYSAFDVLLFPSTYEGLGMACIEAQASDLPIVASTEVPSEAVIISERVKRIALETGYEKWSEEILAAAMSHSSKSRSSQVERLKQSGYDINQSASDLADWYEQLVESSAETSAPAVIKR